MKGNEVSLYVCILHKVIILVLITFWALMG